MLVRAESTSTLAESVGPELDQGALLRLLGERVWFPTTFADERDVTWTPVDERRASATLRVGGREARGIFHCLVYSLDEGTYREVPLFYDSEYGKPTSPTIADG